MFFPQYLYALWSPTHARHPIYPNENHQRRLAMRACWCREDPVHSTMNEFAKTLVNEVPGGLGTSDSLIGELIESEVGEVDGSASAAHALVDNLGGD